MQNTRLTYISQVLKTLSPSRINDCTKPHPHNTKPCFTARRAIHLFYTKKLQTSADSNV